MVRRFHGIHLLLATCVCVVPLLCPAQKSQADVEAKVDQHVEVTLNRRAFSYYDVHRKWTVAPGDFEVYVARSSAEIELTGKVTVQ